MPVLVREVHRSWHAEFYHRLVEREIAEDTSAQARRASRTDSASDWANWAFHVRTHFEIGNLPWPLTTRPLVWDGARRERSRARKDMIFSHAQTRAPVAACSSSSAENGLLTEALGSPWCSTACAKRTRHHGHGTTSPCGRSSGACSPKSSSSVFNPTPRHLPCHCHLACHSSERMPPPPPWYCSPASTP